MQYDYRGIDVGSVAFSPPRRYGTSTTVPLTKKLAVQTPRAPCTIVENKLLVHFDPSLEAHAGFLEFVNTLEDSVLAQNVVLGRMVPSVRGATMSLTLFQGVEWFDRCGAYQEYPPEGVTGVCCLLECTGCWQAGETDNRVYGMRWKVVQLRACDPPPPRFMFLGEVQRRFDDQSDDEGQHNSPPRVHPRS